ncbi:LOW QUALITY PROTEIN: integrator complex assembly factor WDR73-like [Lampetra planeri]
MEESEFADVLDDWFIESLKMYTDLHVYQLECPTQVIAWTSAKTVCVAGYQPSKNEIWELRLPLKLFADDNQGLCAERDFKVVHGGFTDGPVRGLIHIPGTRCLVTSDGLSSSLQVWDVGGDSSDVIRRISSIEGRRNEPGRGSKMAARLSSQPDVLHGVHSSSVQLSLLSSGKTIYESGDSVLWWTDASSGVSAADPSRCRLIRLSSSGRAVVSDLRSPGGVMSQAQLELQTHQCNLEHVSVERSQIYNTSRWKAEPLEAQPMFEHRGHMVSSQQCDGGPVIATTHIWHPERPQTLLSAASDGSVHVWDWIDVHNTSVESTHASLTR